MPLSKRERFYALLSGKPVDRPIVSSWNHFTRNEHNARDLANTTVTFAQTYDWDWIKVNPRATYLAETWGNTYDFNDYQDVFPRQLHAAIETAADLSQIERVDVANSKPLNEQLELLSLVKNGIPDVPFVQTLFSPLSVLSFLAGISPYEGQHLYGSKQVLTLPQLLAENPAEVKRALQNITDTLSDYVHEIEKTGTDGLFYAVTGTANPRFLPEEAFETFSRPYDLQILNQVKKGKVILHTCGDYARPEYFDQNYPFDGISWDVVAPHNAGIEQPMDHTKVGGIHHGYFTERDGEKALANAQTALSANSSGAFILGPDCTVPENAPSTLLHQIRQLIPDR